MDLIEEGRKCVCGSILTIEKVKKRHGHVHKLFVWIRFRNPSLKTRIHWIRICIKIRWIHITAFRLYPGCIYITTAPAFKKKLKFFYPFSIYNFSKLPGYFFLIIVTLPSADVDAYIGDQSCLVSCYVV